MIEQLEFLKEIARRLEGSGIPYMITGSMAMAIYASPRMTRDIDLVIECGPQDADAIVKLFEQDCYIDEEMVRSAIRERSMFNVIHNEWIVKADFILRKEDAYRKTELARRKSIDVDGVRIWFASPEDLVLSKLYWSRESRSEIQRDDVGEIIASLENLDWSYLEKWAELLGIPGLLSEVKPS